VDRTWLQQYPAGVPTDIDPGEYNSLRELFEEAVATHGNKPAYTNLGAT
jgi:long-chain acyl-CoA synthetase